ncbi:MAG: hypothetical protein Q9N32_06750, partial [Gammaproteobacteria bacterium]|nr:hypothetical protein [Gammaproteobacteria bacterium]
MIGEFIASIERSILQMNDTEFWVLATVASCIGLYAFYQMMRKHHIARVIENTPTSKIRSAAQ